MYYSENVGKSFTQLEITKIREIAFGICKKKYKELDRIRLYIQSCFININTKTITIKCNINFNNKITIDESYDNLTKNQKNILFNEYSERIGKIKH